MPERAGVGAGVTVLTNGAMQLRFARESSGYRFTSWVRVDDRWVGAALWPNALGEGVLALMPGSIEPSDGQWLVHGEGVGTGLDGSPVGFGWSGSIAPAAGDGWCVDVTPRGRYEVSWSRVVADADQLAAGVSMSLEGGAWRELEIAPSVE